MTQEYCRAALRVSLAQICQNLGWHSTQATPIELLTDVLERYLLETSKVTHRYAEQFGRTNPTLDDLGLAFRHMGIQISELEDYVKHVESIPFAHDIVSFPAPKKCNLHFPQPGNREISQRDESIPEYLPPMYPEEVEHVASPVHDTAPIQTPTEHTSPNVSGTYPVPGASGQSGEASPAVAGEKRPLTSPPDGPGPPFKRMRLSNSALPEEAGHSQYEMKCMVVNQGGDVTPTSALVGKLPDAKTPPAGLVRKVASKGPVPKGPVKCLTKELQKEAKSDKNEIEISGKKKESSQKDVTSSSKKISLKEKEKSRSPKPSSEKKDTTKTKSKTKKTGLSPGRPPKSRSKSPARAKSPKSAGKAKDQKKVLNEKVTLFSKVQKETTEGKNLPLLGVPLKKELCDVIDLNSSQNAVASVCLTSELSMNKSQPEESPDKRRARLEAIDNAIDAVIKRSARDAQGETAKSNIVATLKEESKVVVPEERILSPAHNEDTNPAIMNTMEVKSTTTPIKTEPVEIPPIVPMETVPTPLPQPITSPLTSPETVKRKKGRPPKVKGRGGRPPGSPKGRKPSVDKTPKTPQILQVPQIPQIPQVPQVIQAPIVPVPVVQEVPLKSPLKKEPEVKEKFSVFDFPESPPVPKPPPPPPEMPPVAVAVGQPSSVTENKHSSHKEKDKHREKSKEHKKEKKEKKKDKEKKKKNKDKERSKSKDKGSKSDIPLPGFTIGKLKIKLGSSPSASTVSYSATPQSPAASPSQRPEIPRLVIKPLPPMPSSQDKGSASPRSTPKSSKKESKGSSKKDSVKKEQSAIPERVKTPPVPVTKQPVSPIIPKKEPSPVPQSKISTPNREKIPEKSKEKLQEQPKKALEQPKKAPEQPKKAAEQPKKQSPEKKKKSPEKIYESLFSDEPPVLKMEVMDEPPVLTPQPPPRPQTPTPPPREVTPPPPPSSKPPPQRFTPSPNPHVSPTPSPRHSQPQPKSPSPLHAKSRSVSPVKTPSPSHTLSPVPSPLPSPLPLRTISHSPTPTKPSTPSPNPTPAHSPSPGPAAVKEESAIPPMPPPSIGAPALSTKASLQRTVISETVGTFFDASGQKIWICPACKMPDDGSPMIGCDICDDWYHWECIGMKESPPEEESWYCVKCVAPQRKTPRPRGRGRGRGRGRKKAQ